MYEVKEVPNCFKGYSVFDDLFGNYDKAKKCQQELERMTGASFALTHVRQGSLMFSDDYQVTPKSDKVFQGIARYFGHFFNFPMGILTL